jgi:hypothetical protein
MKRLLLISLATCCILGIQAQVHFSDDFSTLNNWTLVDADGDGEEWFLFDNMDAQGLHATSASWTSLLGPISPDNWMISIPIDLTAATAPINLDWKVYAQDQAWAAEFYSVYADTTNTTAGLTASPVSFSETLTTSTGYMNRTLNLDAFAGKTVYIAFRHYNSSDWFRMNVDDVVVRSVVANDVSVGDLLMPNYAEQSIPQPVEFEVLNAGSQSITSLSAEYKVGSSVPITELFSGLNIASNSSATLTFTNNWIPMNLGANPFEVKVTLVNGGPDGDTSNNVSAKTITVYDQAYPRHVLYETFTSSTCAPCTPGNANFEGVLSSVDTNEYTSIKYQMSWPGNGDPYFTDEGDDRRNFYAINSVPRLEIDGGWDDNSNSFTALQHTEAVQTPAFVELDAEYEVDVATKTVKTCVDVTSAIDITNQNLFFAILEDTTYNNVESNGETEFYNVMKKLLPGSSGQSISLVAGGNTRVCETYTFNGNYRLPADANTPINHNIEHSVEDFDHLKVAVWMQDLSTLEVFNSHDAHRRPVGTVTSDNAIETSVETFNAKLYPNPAETHTNLEVSLAESSMLNIQIYDIVGKIVEQRIAVNGNPGINDILINTSELENGLYIIKVSNDHEHITRYLTIQH